ncbi:unnamed protein product [Rotaria magnacalcarata]|uniref:TLDc domain-containing protein n=2 Tax=Rotaria magnacalcarata TaxID=392030 RepID=A0A816KYU1_9BILA|nr:unnamed protein product [Rotaria magnacalcarata]
MSAQSIASVMSSVPPVLQYSDSTPTRYYDDDDLDLYNTIQYLVPDQKDHIAMIDFETSASGNTNSPIKVYVSTLEPFPTSDSSDEAQFYVSERCGKVLRLRYYLYMSEQVKRLYIGFVVTAQPQTIKYKVSSIDYFPIKSAGDILSPRHQAIITSFTGMANPKWKLLYKATQDGFRAIDFHRLCDNQTHTVTIIQSKTGYLFGGYAQIPWSSRNTYQTDLKAFIFTLTNPKSVLPTRFLIKGGFEQYSIYHGATYGPTFGGGHDILVPDKSNENSGYTNFPHSYGDTTSYEWWEKSYNQCFADYSNVGRKLKLSEASQNIIRQTSGRQGKSCSIVAKEIAEKQKEYVTRRTISNYRGREGLKPFHVIAKPLKSETHISDRLWLCDWLKDWTEEDFLHLAPFDEFYVWAVRRPNYQNDRIWATSIDDIEEDERYREMDGNDDNNNNDSDRDD